MLLVVGQGVSGGFGGDLLFLEFIEADEMGAFEVFFAGVVMVAESPVEGVMGFKHP